MLKKSEAAGLVEAYSQRLGRAGPLQGASAAAPARAPSAQARRTALLPASPPPPPPPPPHNCCLAQSSVTGSIDLAASFVTPFVGPHARISHLSKHTDQPSSAEVMQRAPEPSVLLEATPLSQPSPLPGFNLGTIDVDEGFTVKTWFLRPLILHLLQNACSGHHHPGTSPQRFARRLAVREESVLLKPRLAMLSSVGRRLLLRSHTAALNPPRAPCEDPPRLLWCRCFPGCRAQHQRRRLPQRFSVRQGPARPLRSACRLPPRCASVPALPSIYCGWGDSSIYCGCGCIADSSVVDSSLQHSGMMLSTSFLTVRT